MVHKQFHMVPSVRRAALTTTTIALLPSFLDIVSTLLSPFPDLASQRLCHRTYHRVMPSRLLYTPADDYATLVSAWIRKTKGRKKEKERVYVGMCTCVCSITVTRPRRSSFSSDEHKSPVMTDRRRSDPSYTRPTAMPATARKCQGVGEALRKNSSPRTELFVYTWIGASKAFCRCQ